jgi:hypothetical protein
MARKLLNNILKEGHRMQVTENDVSISRTGMINHANARFAGAIDLQMQVCVLESQGPELDSETRFRSHRQRSYYMTPENFQLGESVRIVEGCFLDQVGTVESIFESDGGNIKLVWVRLPDHIDGFRPERLRRVKQSLWNQ